MTVASKVLPNIFTQDNTFESDVSVAGDVLIEGNVVVKGDTTNLDVTTLSIEDVVIYLGQGSESAAIAGDRGIVFATADSDSLSFYWDNDKSEFRLARILSMAAPDEFPDDVTYQQLRTGPLISEGNVTIIGSATVGNVITAETLEISDSGTIPSLTNSNFINDTLITAKDITAENIAVSGEVSAASLVIDGGADIDTLHILTDATINGNLHVSSLLDLAGQQFLIAGEGILIEELPETGQLKINSPIGDKKKFIQEIFDYVPAGDDLVFPELDTNIYVYDDDFWDVYVNGMLQVCGEDNDFLVDDDLAIRFHFDLECNDVVIVSVMR
jgi:hypothetical protein